MPSLKALKTRIASVTATRKITKAMQMVAAAKFRRAQEAAQAARPFAESMERVIANLEASQRNNPSAPKLLVGTGKEDTHLVIVAIADRGLCGAFNFLRSRAHIEQLMAAGKTVKVLDIGRKGFDILKRLHRKRMIDMIDLRESRTIRYEHADEIGQRILAMFKTGEFDVARLFYSKFVNVISGWKFGIVSGSPIGGLHFAQPARCHLITLNACYHVVLR